MTVSYEELEAQAQDNRRRLMSSSLFGDDEPSPPPPKQAEPPVTQTAPRYAERPPEAAPYRAQGTTLTERLQRTQPIRPQYVDDSRPDSSVPSISPFGTFRFDIARPGPVSDLGFQRRGPSHVLKATRIELQGTGELRQIRDEMARQAAVYQERVKALVNDEPLKINNENMLQPDPLAQDMSGTQNIATKTEFVFPETSVARPE